MTFDTLEWLVQTPTYNELYIVTELLWLAIVTSLSALASILPAWNAVRVTVRDVLAYE